MKIEYRVRPVTRFVVTRFNEGDGQNPSGCQTKGEYDNEHVAYEVGYALCRAEHQQLGWPPGDERIFYPRHPMHDEAQTVDGVNRLASA